MGARPFLTFASRTNNFLPTSSTDWAEGRGTGHIARSGEDWGTRGSPTSSAPRPLSPGELVGTPETGLTWTPVHGHSCPAEPRAMPWTQWRGTWASGKRWPAEIPSYPPQVLPVAGRPGLSTVRSHCMDRCSHSPASLYSLPCPV